MLPQASASPSVSGLAHASLAAGESVCMDKPNQQWRVSAGAHVPGALSVWEAWVWGSGVTVWLGTTLKVHTGLYQFLKKPEMIKDHVPFSLCSSKALR